MPSRALVIAADSFLGRYVVADLRSAGFEVLGTSHRGLDGLAPCDITHRDEVADLVAGVRPDVIVQCAAATHSSDPGELVAVHCAGALHVLEAAATRAHGAHVILIGTSAEYGPVADEALPVSEDQPPAPTSLFGASKLAQTGIGRAAASEWDLAVTVARPFNLLGPGLPAYYAPARLAARAREGGDGGGVLAVDNPQATRDFVDVRDAARAIGLIASAQREPGGSFEVFNVATGIETSILSLAERVCELASGCTAAPGGSSPSRSGINRSCGDARKLRAQLGWRPRVEWRESVADLWAALAPAAAGADASR